MDAVPARQRDPKSGELVMRHRRWGLVPSWLPDPRLGAKMINARAETLAEKPAFRSAFRLRRCILPVQQFYEFDRTSRYTLSLIDGEPMGIAGLWESCLHGQDEPLLTCTMITCAPNDLVSRVHHRMPAILDPADYERWLDPHLQAPEALSPLLRPYSAERMHLEFDGPRRSVRTPFQAEQQLLLFNALCPIS